jgi:hypothetical protein
MHRLPACRCGSCHGEEARGQLARRLPDPSLLVPISHASPFTPEMRQIVEHAERTIAAAFISTEDCILGRARRCRPACSCGEREGAERRVVPDLRASRIGHQRVQARSRVGSRFRAVEDAEMRQSRSGFGISPRGILEELARKSNDVKVWIVMPTARFCAG